MSRLVRDTCLLLAGIATHMHCAQASDEFDTVWPTSLLQTGINTVVVTEDNSTDLNDGKQQPSGAPVQAACATRRSSEGYECDERNRATCQESFGCGREDDKCDPDFYRFSSSSNGKFMPCCEKKNLLDIMLFLDNLLCGKVEYGLFFGSLLAGVRDRDLIDWDDDADLLVKDEDRDKVWDLLTNPAEGSGSAVNEGFTLVNVEGQWDHVLINYGHNNTLHTDIWFWSQDDVEHDCAVAGNVLYPASWLQSLGAERCYIQHWSFPCPEQPERLLDYTYAHWRPADMKHTYGHPIIDDYPICDGSTKCCGFKEKDEVTWKVFNEATVGKIKAATGENTK